MAMRQAPDGKTTFLFTDIEGSTRKWELHADAMKTALERHDAILSEEIRNAGGSVFKTVGDAFCAAFGAPGDAAKAAEAFQRRLAAEKWGATGEILVRCAVHTGAAVERGGDYFGPTLNRVARILSTGYGGQVLFSSASAGALGAKEALLDLGEHRLKDLERPENIFQLDIKGLKRKFPPLKSLNRFSHNLPVQHTTFIGRVKEKERIKQLLVENSIVTLKGFGGCGKTRLSLQACAELFDRFPDGIFFLELNTLTSKAEILDRLCEILEVQPGADSQPLARLLRHLRARKLLLVFDNCEHLVDAAAELVGAIAAGAPEVRLLATTRESLRLDGETVLELHPLSTEPGKEGRGPSESVLLFLDRIRKTRELRDEDLGLIERVCRELDGIPLAIELAAGLTATMPLGEIARRLDERFSLLRSGKRGAPLQHRTLRAAIDWSYDRLDEPEKKLLRLVSALKWEWTLEACEKAAAAAGLDEGEIVHLHGALVEKSLIVPKDAGRFHLLETVREYAAEKLRDSGELPAALAGITGYYLALAEKTSARLFGDHFEAMRIFREEYSNFLGVADALESSAYALSPETLARLVSALYEYWQAAGMDGEAAERFEACLKKTGLSDKLRAELLMKRARNLNTLGFYGDAGKASLEAQALSAGFPALRAWAHLTAGVSFFYQGDMPKAQAQYETARELFKNSGDKIGLAGILTNLGGLYTDTGELDRVEPLLLRACELYREAGDSRRLAYAITNLGNLYLARKDPAKAETKFREAISHIEKNGWFWLVDLGYTQLGGMAEERGDFEAALSCYARALAGVLKTQCLGPCAECLKRTAFPLFKLGRKYECGALLGAAAVIEKVLNEKETGLFLVQWLESRKEAASPPDTKLSSGFEHGLELKFKDLSAFLGKLERKGHPASPHCGKAVK